VVAALRAGPGRLSLHVLAAFHLGDVGGPARTVDGLMAWLAAEGRVTTLFPTDGTAVPDYRALGDVAVVPYSTLTYARTPRAAARLAAELRRDVRTFRRELRRRRPDLVIAITTVVPAVLVAARLEGIPAITFAAEVYRQRWKSSWPLAAWGGLLARWTARMSAGIVCCSELVAEQFPRGGGPVTVSYPPIGPRYATGDRARGREHHGVTEADPCIAVVGNISRGRGQDVAVRALARIAREAPRARMVIAGRPHPRDVDRAYATELRALVGELGLAGAVVFTDETDVPDLYAAADVVVNPARFDEPFGRVVPEALMAGRPVVATDVGAVHEVIRDRVHGLIVPSDDPEAMADAILRLWRDPGRAAEMVAAGRQRVIERFSPEQDLAAWRGVIEAVSTRRGR
jgi:glycosyltransferase involved in cell wall biosynthesis